MSQKGYTLIEILVASAILLLIFSMVGGHITFQKNVFSQGAVRSRLNQNIRGTLDIVGADIRIGGENLPIAFPSFLITNGGSSPDELTVRRAVLDDALPVCTSITSGSTTATIVVADNASTAPGCSYSGIKNTYNTWSAHRIAQGGSVKAYIFNISTRDGEFVNYSGESDLTTKLQLTRSGGGSFAYSYPAGSSALYVLEEWKYKVVDDELQIIQNGDTSAPLSVMFGVKDFQIQAVMNDTSIKTSFIKSDNWTLIKKIDVSIDSNEFKGGKEIVRNGESSYFPRNILSF